MDVELACMDAPVSGYSLHALVMCRPKRVYCNPRSTVPFNSIGDMYLL